MYGCGKFTDEDFLEYCEGSVNGSLKNEMDEHMETCVECLEEAAELTRVNAAMEGASPLGLPQTLILRAFADGGKFLGFSWNGGVSRLVPAPAVRSGVLSGEALRAEGEGFAVILTASDGQYDLELEGNGNDEACIYIPGEVLPLWKGRLDAGTLRLRGIPPGNYDVSVGGKKLRLMAG